MLHKCKCQLQSIWSCSEKIATAPINREGGTTDNRDFLLGYFDRDIPILETWEPGLPDTYPITASISWALHFGRSCAMMEKSQGGETL